MKEMIKGNCFFTMRVEQINSRGTSGYEESPDWWNIYIGRNPENETYYFAADYGFFNEDADDTIPEGINYIKESAAYTAVEEEFNTWFNNQVKSRMFKFGEELSEKGIIKKMRDPEYVSGMESFLYRVSELRYRLNHDRVVQMILVEMGHHRTEGMWIEYPELIKDESGLYAPCMVGSVIIKDDLITKYDGVSIEKVYKEYIKKITRDKKIGDIIE